MSGSSRVMMIDVWWGNGIEAAAEINFLISGGFTMAPVASLFNFPIQKKLKKKKKG